ncbi:D-alanyl-D-alanine carboxypeptidase/D-alanyl-D-alanine-endopeptidase [Conyzicola nivalis]|uniref:D-alanyl-D-alanine carboxypeptidase/D-alanyl-D-alanine-endopeptidase n=1 Tax=Conyzicola nivalis TaxID=1477021 RepID=UPI001E5F5973|nr:D-alanyl-D-alanine carboxypeptidase [Conyzicola nivalis]
MSEPEVTPHPARKGLSGAIRKHPTAWLTGALAVVFLMLGTGAVFAGAAVGGGTPAAEAEVTPDTGESAAPTPTTEAEAGRSVPATLPGATRLRTCSVAGPASDPRLMGFKGYVMNATTGEVLFSREGDVPNRTGSVMKVLTASAALSALGPDYRLTTKVVAGATPNSIVLVGGGDPTLSASGSSVYAGAPKIADLAAKAKAAHDAAYPGTPITEVVLDASYWNPADKWDPIWKRTEQTIGYHSEVTALMVDGDRADPARNTSPRSTDPVGRAGTAFVAALGLPGVTVTTGTASSSTVLAEVQSQPVSSLIPFMLLTSDNTLAEMLARVVSVKSGFGGSSASLQQAIPAALKAYGVPVDALTIKDGSGLSEANAVPPEYVAKLMVKVLAGGQNLSIVYNALPVAGKSGSLASRFTGGNSVAGGNVIAKTGWIDTAYTLGGVIKAADGTPLTFAFYAIGSGIQENAKVAIDTLATSVYSCGDNLANI